MPKNILKVALDVPLDRLFDYLDGGFSVQVGERVVVPFGRRNVVGVVIEKSDSSEFALEKLNALLNKCVFNLAQKLSREQG